ncbi:GNAT family N-acetyltransferase [Paenibacillus sacheonensis]|uniref:GNAT family N-acetyltransferase n=1 Tax=Paenibacillus sacheonensis TaxID=742054 RepID=A0A7X4YTR8_9BACL|nr:GNAT family N-acetyltransferase [Paenibacillus sacheonensis]MBM7567489.1 GNAT superfamily N-acetyltransferase [Paenibacillus sacheonensis]NBC71406.1 GNAT family N-acetyltransferase [Paenibacillus sacheonensis]
MSNPPRAELQRFNVIPLSEAHAEQLSSWRYEPPFDFYNWTTWQVMLELGMEFGDPDIRTRQYAAVLDSDGDFIGFAQFFPLLGLTRLGLGLRPDLCDQGLGLSFVQAIVAEALRRAPDYEIDLEVHTWNDRAILTYQRAGFIITDTYAKQTHTGLVDVYCMCYLPEGAQ